MKITMKLWVLFFGVLVLGNVAYAQTPRAELQQMVEQLQKTPNDNALREKIIVLATSIKPAPAIPEEAREPFVMGATVLKKASDPAGASKAVDLFTQALNIAPWFADAYYNRAIAREAAGQFESAIEDLKFYLGFKLTDSERREAQDKIYSLKADAQLGSAKKAEEQKAAAAKAAAQAAAERERLRPTVEGKWSNPWGISFQVVRNGEQFSIIGGDQQGFKPPTTWRARDVVADRQHIRFLPVSDNPGIHNAPIQLSLSADGSKLEGGYLGPDGGVNITPAYTRVP